MGLPLIFIAAILFAAAYQNQLGYLATNAEQDIKGFLPWMAAMIAIGAIGLIPKAKPVSNALLFLVILVLLISNKGFFANIQSGQAFKPVSPPAAPVAPGATDTPPAAPPGTQASGQIDPGTTSANSGPLSNIIPFPSTSFGPFSLGNVLGGTISSVKPPSTGGVTIESIDIKPNG